MSLQVHKKKQVGLRTSNGNVPAVPNEENITYQQSFPETPWHDVIVKYSSIKIGSYEMNKTEFDENFTKKLQQGINECGLLFPFKIQSYCLPYLFKKDNVIIYAEKGSGKTISALMAVLGEMTKTCSRPTYTRAIIVCRTCLAALNTFEQLKEMAKFCRQVKICLAIKKYKVSGKVLDQVIVGTPDKILEMKSYLGNDNEPHLLVIDDVEALEAAGDWSYSERLIQISNMLRVDKIVLLCATQPSYKIETFLKEVTEFWPYSLEFPFPRRKFSHRQIFVECSSLKDRHLLVEKAVKREGQIIFICKNKEMCESVAEFLKNSGKNFVVLHSKIKDPKRQYKIAKQFEDFDYDILIATPDFVDVKAPNLHTVINCKEILNDEKTRLNHLIYSQHLSLLDNSRQGYLINVIPPSWANYVFDENGDKLHPLSIDDLRF